MDTKNNITPQKHFAFLAGVLFLLLCFHTLGWSFQRELYAQDYDEAGSYNPEDENVSGDVDPGSANGEEYDKKYEIYVNIPSFNLRLISSRVVEKKYRIRVGSPKHKTVTGEGEITRKFAPSYFRYSDGPQKGEIIRYSNIKNKYQGRVIKRIKIPYEKMKGLEIEINGEITGQIFHATTNPETLGHACSTGCMGLSIEDMLDLYKRVGPGTKVVISYNTVEFVDGVFYFYDDIYGQNPDPEEMVMNELSANGISYTDEFVKTIVKKGKANKKVNISDVFVEIKEKLAVEELK